MSVIETSSDERYSQAKDLFEKIKPLLDKGWIYSRAVRKVTDKSSGYDICSKAWFKDVVEYGESQGYCKEDYWGVRHGGRKKG